MQKLFTAVAVLFAITTAARAQTVTVWQGSLQITGLNATCRQDGYKKGQYFTSVFRPANIDGNGPDTRLTIVGGRSMHRMNMVGQNFSGNGTYEGRYLSSRAGHGTWTGTFEKAKVAPTVLTNTKQVVIITGKINNFWATTGCSILFRGVYSRRLQ